VPIVRTMPNRPALVGIGVTALHAGPGVDDRARDMADQILGACGATVWVDDESLMDAVTAVSGTGPAYFFLLIEALEAAAIEQGLEPATARRLAIETAHGAGRMAALSSDAPADLRARGGGRACYFCAGRRGRHRTLATARKRTGRGPRTSPMRIPTRRVGRPSTLER
jgi:pyrroline-5-carboxylate reductase